MRYAGLGSVSSGTMRQEDLLDTLAGELEYQMERQPSRHPRAAHRALIRDAHKALRTDPASEDAGYVLGELFDALGEYAPPYCYFGAHEGDGADYGFWPGHDYDLKRNVEEGGGIVVDDTSEVPRDHRGEVLAINDHGNVALYVAYGRAGRAPKLREVWACV